MGNAAVERAHGWEAFTSAWDGVGDPQVGLGAEAGKGAPGGSKPGKAPMEVGHLGVAPTRTVCGDSRAPSPLLLPDSALHSPGPQPLPGPF